MSRIFKWAGFFLVPVFAGLVLGAIWIEDRTLSDNLGDTAGLIFLLMCMSFFVPIVAFLMDD